MNLDSLPLTAAELSPQQVRALAESAGLDAQICERLTRTAPNYSTSDAGIVAQLWAGFMLVGGRWVEPTLLDIQAIEERIARLAEQISREQDQADRVKFHLHLSAEAKRKAAIVATGVKTVTTDAVDVEPVDSDGRIDPGPFNPPLPDPPADPPGRPDDPKPAAAPQGVGDESLEMPASDAETPAETPATTEGGSEAADSGESVSGDDSGPTADSETPVE